MKRMVAMVLSILMCIILVPISCLAVAQPIEEMSLECAVQESTISIANNIEESDLFIDSTVAEAIAELFIADVVEIGSAVWNEDSSIVNVVTLYNEDSTEITAYAFELQVGYVIISAYLDVPNIILEWSDEVSPVYSSFDLATTDTVVYLGALEYYKDTGSATLEYIDGQEVNRIELDNTLEDIRSIDHISDDMLAVITEDNLEDSGVSVLGAGDVEITDPFYHAQTYYGGTFSHSDSCNYWGGYMPYYTTAMLKNVTGTTYSEHCGPTAITNLVRVYGNRYGDSVIGNMATSQLFGVIASQGELKGYYTNGEGTEASEVGLYIRHIFDVFGTDVTVNKLTANTYANIKSVFMANGLMYVGVSRHGYYGSHGMAGFAYTRLINSAGNAYKTYIKVADGLSSGGRYLDLAYLTDTSKARLWAIDL